jgi:replicative DNA helicase
MLPTSIENGLKQKENLLEEQKPSISGVVTSSSSIEKSTTVSQDPTKRLLSSLKHTSEILETVLESIYTRGTSPKYPTGLKELDEVIWGVHKKELMIIGARTSQGKSSLAMQLALNLADLGARVGYFSLEMSREQLMERIIAHVSRIDARLIRCGLAKDKIKAQEKFLRGFIPNLKILFDDESGYTFDNIVTICEELKFDFVFVDYIQMISIRGYKSKLEAIEEYVRKFKELCKVLDMGGILISQINRQGVGEDMSMHHLKSAGCLEEHPDTVILLDWNKIKDEYQIRVEKQRHGEVKTVNVDYVPEHFKFSDWKKPSVLARRETAYNV